MSIEVIINHVNEMIIANMAKEAIKQFVETWVENEILAKEILARIGG